MYFLLLRWECISYHIMQCAEHTPTVSVGIGDHDDVFPTDAVGIYHIISCSVL